MMMMYMAWPAEQGRRRINLTAEASRSMDGWVDGWMDGKGREHRAQQTAPRKKLRSPNPCSIYYIHAGQRLRTWTPPSPWSTEYKVQPPTKSLPSTTQARVLAHTHTISRPAGVRPTCNQRTGPVQRHTRPFHCCSIDCRCKIHVNKRHSGSCREFLSRAPAPAQGSSSQTVEPQSDDTRPAASASASAASAVR